MKIRNEFEKRHHHTCLNRDSAVCDNVNCTSAAEVIPCDADVRNSYDSTSRLNPDIVEEYDENEGVKELMVIGAGPHALALLLRLLEPEPDFWSDEERHKRAEKTKLMKHYHDVYRHLKNLSRGPSYTLKQTKKRKKSSHPPLTLKDIWESSLVVDAHGDWMASWKRNFQNIGITKLRSLMNAHADPYDHRSMEYFAESNKRGHDLVTLKSLSQRDDKFRGPYQVPTTKLFHDFHDLLIKGYGIDSLVQKGFVRSINPVQNSRNTKEGLFEVKIDYGDKIKTFVTKRVVCALGPNFNKDQMWWEREINHKMSNISDNHNPKILSADEIVPWLETHERDCKKKEHGEKPMRLLVVGGGITSAQLALKAKKSPWCESVTFIQRSMSLSRHFDVENHWLGSQRGKFLDSFWSLNMEDRAHHNMDARKGGSIPPDILEELYHKNQNSSGFEMKEEVEISDVDWKDGKFHVSLDDGSEIMEFDMIWLATGSRNHIDKYSCLHKLRETLSIETVHGLPVLKKDLSLVSTQSNGDREIEWKRNACKNFYCLGALAGLELGPDALNLIGARHGAVRVAKAIRTDMKIKS